MEPLEGKTSEACNIQVGISGIMFLWNHFGFTHQKNYSSQHLPWPGAASMNSMLNAGRVLIPEMMVDDKIAEPQERTDDMTISIWLIVPTNEDVNVGLSVSWREVTGDFLRTGCYWCRGEGVNGSCIPAMRAATSRYNVSPGSSWIHNIYLLQQWDWSWQEGLLKGEVPHYLPGSSSDTISPLLSSGQ